MATSQQWARHWDYVRALVAILALGGSGYVQVAKGQDASTIAVERIATIGVESGDPHQEFGAIDGIAVDDRRGVLFLVDHLNSRLSAFGRDGDFIAATGRAGDGPGEFRYAGAVASSGSTIYVLDRRNLRVSTFSLQRDSLALTGETRLPFDVTDACLLNEHVYALGYNRGRLVHRFDHEGRVTESFGEPFRNGDPVMAALTAFGLIRCDHATQSVFVAAISTPTVRRYSATGQLLWEAPVPDMAPSVITRTPSGVQYSAPPNREASDVMLSLVPTPGGLLLVQFGESFRGMGAREDIVDAKSVVFDIEDGAIVQTSNDLPRIDFASGSYAYSRANEPFPRVVVYRWN